MEEATFLTKFARSVTIVHRRDELRASKIMAERAVANDKIRFAWNSEVAAIHGDDKVTGVTLRDTGDRRDPRAAPSPGLFVAIGHDPRNELVKGVVDLDEAGYVLVEGRTTPDQRRRASSPAATWSTTPTARPSPPPAPAAPPPWTPSAILAAPATTSSHRRPAADASAWIEHATDPLDGPLSA